MNDSRFKLTGFSLASVLCAIFLFVVKSPVHAEHHVALLIGNSNYQDKTLASPAKDLNALATGLSKFGVRCTVLENLDENGLRTAIEAFANSTPTRGTAIVYFSGHVLAGSHQGKSDACLMGTNSGNGRGYPIESVFDLLSTRGGSDLNIVIADSPQTPAFKATLPANSFFEFHDHANLLKALKTADNLGGVFRDDQASLFNEGKGSVSVSPPSTFVIGKEAGDEWVNSRGMVFCWCPPGSYVAGSPVGTPGRYADETQRKVEIREGFWIAKYETTVDQWIGNRPRELVATGKNIPVHMISQTKDCSRTTRPLNEAEWKTGRLPKDWEYAVPTEDQWEYAARAGTSDRFYFGNDINELPAHANFGDKSFYDSKDIYSNAAHRVLNDGVVKLAPVGSFKPNPWGLYDIYGNVSEWCQGGISRGGAWLSVADNCRSAYRQQLGDRDQRNYIGVRLVIQKIPPPKKKP